MIEKPITALIYSTHLKDGKFYWLINSYQANNILKYSGDFIDEHSDPSGGKIVDYVFHETSAIVLNDKGEIFRIGSSNSGQLGPNATGTPVLDKTAKGVPFYGKGPFYSKLSKINTPEGKKIKSIHTPYTVTDPHVSMSTIILTEDGSVYTAGSNAKGQLGVPGSDKTSWSKVNLPPVTRVSSNQGMTIAQSGTDFYAWGVGGLDRMGVGLSSTFNAPPELLNRDAFKGVLKLDVSPYGYTAYYEDKIKIKHEPRPYGSTIDVDLSKAKSAFSEMVVKFKNHAGSYTNMSVVQTPDDRVGLIDSNGSVTPLQIPELKGRKYSPFVRRTRVMYGPGVTDILGLIDEKGCVYAANSIKTLDIQETRNSARIYSIPEMAYSENMLSSIMSSVCSD